MSVLKNSLLVGVSVLTLGGTALALTSIASAQTATGDNLVEKIATKFSLNKEDVRAVFDEERTERQKEHRQELSERLQAKVDDGDITAEQKTLIETKLDELSAARDAEREALQTWADENGIDIKYVMFGGRGMMHGDSSRLQNAVDDGDITAEQKTLIENKLQELKDARETRRDELKQWAEDNRIDEKFLRGGMKMGGRGHGGPGVL